MIPFALNFFQKFLCGGRLIFGPDASSLFLSTFLIGAPAISFCIKIAMEISEFDLFYDCAILTGGIILTVLVGQHYCTIFQKEIFAMILEITMELMTLRFVFTGFYVSLHDIC